MLSPAGSGKNAISRTAAVQALQPILSALLIESSCGPGVLEEKTQKKIALRIFDLQAGKS
jgi:hypothetical protein